MKNATQTTLATAFLKAGILDELKSMVGSSRKLAKAPKAETAKVKVPNYTAEQETYMTKVWLANPIKTTTEALALELGKTVRSVVAKLARTKGADGKSIYVSPNAYKSKDGAPVVKKDTLADSIGLVLRLSENDTTSLTKITKPALRAIFAALANSVPLTPENDAIMVAGEYHQGDNE